MPRTFHTYPLPGLDWKARLLAWARHYDPVCLLDSSNHPQANPGTHTLLAVGKEKELVPQEDNPFDALQQFYDAEQDWLFGYLSYDLKNDLEDLSSNHPDHLEWPAMHFFQPSILLLIGEDHLQIGLAASSNLAHEVLWQEILATPLPDTPAPEPPHIQARLSKEAYLSKVQKLKDHIRHGDIYEVNFCQEFFAHGTIDPAATYLRLNRISPTPFSCYYQKGPHHLLCGSPERFMRKKGNKIISQPIKGTAPRGRTKAEDEQLKTTLQHNPKDRSENVMIVDLVRNDLSRTARKGSVKVEELFGIYTFPKVHQMISTVSAELREGTHFVDTIRYAFPMGSMTGAPKIRAMELIEDYEVTKRGLYSGAVGYISPEGDFDFNVVIRSINYNAHNAYLSFMVGGAIIDASDPEAEYYECLLKASAIRETLGVTEPQPLHTT